MRNVTLAAVALLGLAIWHLRPTDGTAGRALVAYKETVQGYEGSQTLRRSSVPQQARPMAEETNASGVEARRST